MPSTTGALTKEHGTRDIRREKIVTKTFDDPHRGPQDTAMIGKLATVQLFMSPREELEAARAQIAQSKKLVYSQFKDIGDISGSNTGNFDKLLSRVQTVHETEKMHAARNLLVAGYGTLVAETHKQLLRQTQGDVDKAMELLHQESSNPQPQVKFNTAKSSRVPRLDLQSLRRMSQDKSLPEPPLSPVRPTSASSFHF